MTAPMTDREAPAPWAVCDVCGGTVAALTDPDGTPRCPRCAVDALKNDAALAQLQAMTAPLLGAWANHWTRAGLGAGAILGAVEQLTGAWMHAQAQRAHLRDALVHTMRAHRPPTLTAAPPDRVTLNMLTMPALLAATVPTAPRTLRAGGRVHDVTFKVRHADGTVSEGVTLPPGPDAVLILNMTPDGDAALYFTGIHGQTDPQRRSLGKYQAVRVPAQLLAQVRAALGYWAEGEA